MKKHFLFTLPCALFSTATRVLLLTALVALMANTTKTFAQTEGTKYKTPDNIDELVGIDPSDDYLSRTGPTMPPDNKLLYIYNVGANRFLSPGGKWGTQASLDNTPYPFWLNEPSGDSDEFNIVLKSATPFPKCYLQKRNGLLIRKTAIKSSRPFHCAYHPLTP